MKENMKEWLQFILSWMLIIAVFMGIVGIAFSLYSVSGVSKNQPSIPNTFEIHNVANIPKMHEFFKLDNKTAYHINNTTLVIITGESQRK